MLVGNENKLARMGAGGSVCGSATEKLEGSGARLTVGPAADVSARRAAAAHYRRLCLSFTYALMQTLASATVVVRSVHVAPSGLM